MNRPRSTRLRWQEQQILAVLQTHARPLTTGGLASATGMSYGVTHTTLRRLVRQGKVVGELYEEHRPWAHGGTQKVTWWEWRTKTQQEKRSDRITKAIAKLDRDLGGLDEGDLRDGLLEVVNREGKSA